MPAEPIAPPTVAEPPPSPPAMAPPPPPPPPPPAAATPPAARAPLQAFSRAADAEDRASAAGTAGRTAGRTAARSAVTADPLTAAIDHLAASGASGVQREVWTRWRQRGAGAWQAVAPAAAGRAEDPGPGAPMHAPDGVELGRVWFEPDAVVWRPAGTATRWRLPMAPQELDALRAGLGLPPR